MSDKYFSSNWEPKLEFWIKTWCPSCSRSNFLSVTAKSMKDIDAFLCCGCEKLHWLRPRWSVEEMYSHLLKSTPEADDGYENYTDLLSHEHDQCLKTIHGQSRTNMGVVKK